MEQVRIGVIGGSGVYDMAQAEGCARGSPGYPVWCAVRRLYCRNDRGRAGRFLPRHGRGHRISPGRLNARANIYGFKKLGVEYLISISACGSLQPEHKPGDIVVPDQLFDRTRAAVQLLR